jgi:predicted nucleic acid-binding Zn finger protein
MTDKSEINLLENTCKNARKEKRLTGKDLGNLHKVFGKRFINALETLRENRVKKYVFKPSRRVVWIVVGKKRDYLLMPEAQFCSCDDFYFRVLDKEIHLCYHLIAQKIAEILKWFEKFEENDEIFESLMNEWRNPIP